MTDHPAEAATRENGALKCIDRPTGRIGLGKRKLPGKLIMALPGEQDAFEAVKLWVANDGGTWTAIDESGWEWPGSILWYEMPAFAALSRPPQPDTVYCETCNKPIFEGQTIFTTKTGLVHMPCPHPDTVTEEMVEALRASLFDTLEGEQPDSLSLQDGIIHIEGVVWLDKTQLRAALAAALAARGKA